MKGSWVALLGSYAPLSSITLEQRRGSYHWPSLGHMTILYQAQVELHDWPSPQNHRGWQRRSSAKSGVGQTQPADIHCNYWALLEERVLSSWWLCCLLGWNVMVTLRLIILSRFSNSSMLQNNLEGLFKHRLLHPTSKVQRQECVFLTNSQVMMMMMVHTTLWEPLSNCLVPSWKRPPEKSLWPQCYTTMRVASDQLVSFDVYRHWIL